MNSFKGAKSFWHPFKANGILRLDRRHILERLSGRRRQQAAHVEELVLDPAKILLQLCGRRGGVAAFPVHRPGQSYRSVQLVHGSVRLDTEAVFRDLLSTGESRFPSVARSRVDLRDTHRSSYCGFATDDGPS